MLRQRIGKNEKGGRDFVCGDLHGCYERLLQFLEHVNFDFEKDRLFSVGDLVDRGPQSYECLMLIYEPWFFPVRGNHEQLMMDYFNDGPTGMWWAPNGGSWGLAYDTEKSDVGMHVRDAMKKVAELPVMLTVEKQDGTFFHIIHAELGGVTPLSDKLLDDEDTFRHVAFAPSSDGECIIWGRYIFLSLYGAALDEHRIDKFNRTAEFHKAGAIFSNELSHIYSGHTIVRKPVRFMGQTNLDTGAYKSIREIATVYGRTPQEPPEWAGLTFTEPLTDKFWTVNEKGVFETEVVKTGY